MTRFSKVFSHLILSDLSMNLISKYIPFLARSITLKLFMHAGVKAFVIKQGVQRGSACSKQACLTIRHDAPTWARAGKSSLLRRVLRSPPKSRFPPSALQRHLLWMSFLWILATTNTGWLWYAHDFYQYIWVSDFFVAVTPRLEDGMQPSGKAHCDGSVSGSECSGLNLGTALPSAAVP